MQPARLRKSSLSPFLSLLLLAAPLAHARLDSPVTERAEQLSREAQALSRSPRALAPLIRLHGLRDEVDDLNLLAQTYANLVYRHGTEPNVRALATQLYADIERARGHLAKSRAMLEPLGFVQSFYAVGGFDNEGKGGCDTDFGPEGAALDLSASYPGKSREVSWRKVPVSSLDGYVDLSTLVRPSSEVAAYALTFLEASEETRSVLSVGAGAFRLWVNGQLVASSNAYNVPRPDQARVQVRLRKGPNRVLLKLCQERGPLGFYLRTTRGEGARGLARASLPESAPPLGKGPPPSPTALPTAVQLLERELAKAPGEVALLADYATVLSYFRAFDEREQAAAALAERAAELAPREVEVRLVAAQLQSEDHNLRRKHLEAAVEADPSHPRTRLALAQHELSMDHPERALPLFQALIKAHPNLSQARLGEARALEALGEWPRAAERIAEAAKRLPYLPGVVTEAARVARRLDRLEEAIARTRTALGLRFDDAGSRRVLANLLADLGRVDEAGQQLEMLLSLDPFDNSARLRRAELYAANGRVEQALALFSEAKRLAPDEPDVHEREGRALLHAGRRDEALEAFSRALTLRPQHPALKEVLKSLRGEDAPVGTQYVLPVKPLLAEARAHAGEDLVYLVDYTFVRVQPSGLSSRFQQLAVKVFNQRGVEAFRSYTVTYSPDRQEVRVLRARVTKPDGSVVDGYSDGERHINEPWTGMYYDARAKVLSFPSLAPGDVLELELRLDDTAAENLLSDYWGDVDYVQGTYPKLRYQYFVEMPQARRLYWNRSRVPATVVSSEEPVGEGRVLYKWTSRDVPKVVPEPSMPGWAEVVSTLHVSTYQTWEQVGRYYWSLVRDQLAPNEELRRTVEKVLQGVDRKDELAVVRAIYGFVVMNTRYVALEFGIHGYKPYRVDRVLARRFGDCKDKASLIHAMLKVAGIDSRLVLLRMRSLGTIGEEPASLAAFNHAIAYVPKHQLFLDGTAELHGSRELPSADRVADILVVEPDGKSPFGRTPEASAEDNLTTQELEVSLAPDGSASITGKSVVAGQSAPEFRRAYLAPATRRAAFEQGWAQAFPGLTVKSVSIGEPTRIEEPVAMSFALEVPRFAEAGQNLLRFHPLGSGRGYTQAYAPLSERKLDLVLSGPWASSVRYRYRLPAGFSVPELQPEVKEDSPFGRLRLGCRDEGAALTCEAELALTVARVKASDYPAFRAWLGRVDQAFSRKLSAASVPVPVR